LGRDEYTKRGIVRQGILRILATGENYLLNLPHFSDKHGGFSFEVLLLPSTSLVVDA
jgi:hypothetical protein